MDTPIQLYEVSSKQDSQIKQSHENSEAYLLEEVDKPHDKGSLKIDICYELRHLDIKGSRIYIIISKKMESKNEQEFINSSLNFSKALFLQALRPTYNF